MTEITEKYTSSGKEHFGSKSVRLLAKMLPKTLANIEDAKPLIKSSGQLGLIPISNLTGFGHWFFEFGIYLGFGIRFLEFLKNGAESGNEYSHS